MENLQAALDSLPENERKLMESTLADFVIQRRQEPDIFAWTKSFHEAESYLTERGLNMYRRVMKSENGNKVTVEDPVTKSDREMIMLGSNSYLGLNTHPKVKQAALDAVEKYGVGAGSPPHFSGYYDLHRELESMLAKMKGAEDAILFPSGYATNVGLISCFLGSKDTVIIDKLAHASIIDGAIMSGAKITTFRHNDMNSLERVLSQTEKNTQGDRLVIVEGVYSMDGDIAPLNEIYELTKKYNAKIMVDEAHATGVLGKTGMGSPEHFDLEGKLDLVMGTFSKSLGGIGGFVTGKTDVIKYLRYYSRAYFFAASPTPMQVAAQIAAIKVLQEEPKWHQKLWENIRYFHGQLRDRGYDIERTQTAITPIVIGETQKMRAVTKYLHDHDIFINPVPYPAVARKKDRLRVSLSALHTRKDLDRTLEVLDAANELYPFASPTK